MNEVIKVPRQIPEAVHLVDCIQDDPDLALLVGISSVTPFGRSDIFIQSF